MIMPQTKVNIRVWDYQPIPNAFKFSSFFSTLIKLTLLNPTEPNLEGTDEKTMPRLQEWRKYSLEFP
jgi:hypothetical protein